MALKRLFWTCGRVFQVTEVGLSNNAEDELLLSAVSVLGLQLSRGHRDAVSSVPERLRLPERKQPDHLRARLIQRLDLSY